MSFYLKTGFSLRESDRWVLVLHNPSDRAATAPLSWPAGLGKAQRYDDVTGKGKPFDRAPQINLPAQRHALIVGQPSGQP